MSSAGSIPHRPLPKAQSELRFTVADLEWCEGVDLRWEPEIRRARGIRLRPEQRATVLTAFPPPPGEGQVTLVEQPPCALPAVGVGEPALPVSWLRRSLQADTERHGHAFFFVPVGDDFEAVRTWACETRAQDAFAVVLHTTDGGAHVQVALLGAGRGRLRTLHFDPTPDPPLIPTVQNGLMGAVYDWLRSAQRRWFGASPQFREAPESSGFSAALVDLPMDGMDHSSLVRPLTFLQRDASTCGAWAQHAARVFARAPEATLTRAFEGVPEDGCFAIDDDALPADLLAWSQSPLDLPAGTWARRLSLAPDTSLRDAWAGNMCPVGDDPERHAVNVAALLAKYTSWQTLGTRRP